MSSGVVPVGPVEAPDGPARPSAGPGRGPDSERPAGAAQRVALVDLLDRLLAGGVVISGDVTLSIADVDMVTISLRALLSSVGALADVADGTEDRRR